MSFRLFAQTMNSAPENAPHAQMPVPQGGAVARSQSVSAPAKGERIIFIGNGLAERDVHYGRLETELHLRYPQSELFIRNMGHARIPPAPLAGLPVGLSGRREISSRIKCASWQRLLSNAR
jgi:hypothetical protein